MDVTKNDQVMRCILANRQIREDNKHLRKDERRPIPGEMEFFDFLTIFIENQQKTYVSEGGDPRSLKFLDWVKGRTLDVVARAELAMKVPYSDEQIAALATEVRSTVYQLRPTGIHPVELEVDIVHLGRSS